MNEPELAPPPAAQELPEPAPPAAEQVLPAPERRARAWFAPLHRVLPWLSLALGATSAYFMDRGPKRAALVAVAASALWLTLTVTHWLLRVELIGTSLGRTRRRLVQFARYSGVLITQSIVQLCLFFALPFYFRASTLAASDIDPGHAAFMLGLCAFCATSLWDPWTEWLLRRPFLSPALPAVASFVALNTVLPGYGLSTQRSLWIAAGSTVFGVAMMSAGAAPVGKRLKRAAKAALFGLAIPASLALGAARVIPPAPLRLARAEFGVARQGKWIAEAVTRLTAAPQRLICATAIASPSGLHDRLFHVWRKDGLERARLELEIVGGRREGYRTMSWLQGLGAHPAGRYSCSVVTAAGQVLGTRHIQIGTDKVAR